MTSPIIRLREVFVDMALLGFQATNPTTPSQRLFYARTAPLYRWLAHGQHRNWRRWSEGVRSVRLQPDTTYVRKGYFGATQLKFDASFKSPVPLYIATCGCGHKGRWNAMPLAASLSLYLVAITFVGAVPFSTQR